MKSRIALSLCLCLCLLVASTASAADWRSLGGSSIEEFFLDVTSIARVSDYPQAWTKLNYVTPQTVGGKTYQSMISLMYFDCAAQESGHRSGIFYEGKNGEGARIYSETTPVHSIAFTPSAPDTFGEKALWVVCARYAPHKR
ncbi:MAG: hypothetical protein JWR22_2853 [Herminiimonas sp.]|nr:hypothetical protein [Herminiimonas sp.]